MIRTVLIFLLAVTSALSQLSGTRPDLVDILHPNPPEPETPNTSERILLTLFIDISLEDVLAGTS